ncbi:hypothetical protein SBA2_890006 [Acidobacteriia bacterium SbA2]|nr:hypothetical protein SBA2_890006 [Acidobacteriia bacterium SbA2]
MSVERTAFAAAYRSRQSASVNSLQSQSQRRRTRVSAPHAALRAADSRGGRPYMNFFLLQGRRIFIGGLGLVGVDLAVVFGVKRTVLGVQILRGHGEDVAVLRAFEACRVVSAVGVDHTLGEGSGVHEFCERGGEMIVLLVELALGADDDEHVADREVFGVGARGNVG